MRGAGCPTFISGLLAVDGELGGGAADAAAGAERCGRELQRVAARLERAPGDPGLEAQAVRPWLAGGPDATLDAADAEHDPRRRRQREPDARAAAGAERLRLEGQVAQAQA